MTAAGPDGGTLGSARVVVDGRRCQGHNRCVATCPEVFEADEYGYSIVKVSEVEPHLLKKVKLAAANCPENAISVEDRASPGVRGGLGEDVGPPR